MAETPEKYDLDVELSYPDGVRPAGEAPYRMLVISDFAGSEAGSVSGPLADGLVEVTADTLGAVMAEACPTVRYTTSDPLASGSVMVEVNLRFDSLRAFDPKVLVEQISGTQALTAIREKLVARLLGKASSDELKDAVRAAAADDSLSWLTEVLQWVPAAAPADPDAVDSLLGQIDVGDDGADASAPPPKSPIGAVVSAAAGAGASVPAEEASAVRRGLAEIDRRVSIWLTAVLHAPQVQAVEAAWRSLAFLVAHTDFRKGVRISILHAPRDAITARFTSRVIDPVFDEGADAPDLVVVDHAFASTAADSETLDELAQHAASLPAVVLVGASPAFFGVKHAWQMPTLPAIATMFDQWQFAKWKALRQERYAHALGVVFGRGLLRAAHGRDEDKSLAFAYHEACISDKDLVWMNGSVAAACAVSRSVADSGWPCAMAGFVHGRLDGFAITHGGKKGDKQFGPTDTQMPQPKIEELAVAGINALVGIREHEDALVWNGLTAARPTRMEPDALLEVSLPYQLFAVRLSVLLFGLKPHLAGQSADAIVPFVTRHVCQWLHLEGDGEEGQLSVQTRAPEDDPRALELAVTVTPPPKIVAGGIPVVLGYRIG